MLKNVHLAPGWLMQLEKKLHSLQPHACFRLFLTMEINPKVSKGVGALGAGASCVNGVHSQGATCMEARGSAGCGGTCLQPQNLGRWAGGLPRT